MFLFVFLERVCAWEWNHWVSWFFLKSCFDSGVPVHMCIVRFYYFCFFEAGFHTIARAALEFSVAQAGSAFLVVLLSLPSVGLQA